MLRLLSLILAIGIYKESDLSSQTFRTGVNETASVDSGGNPEEKARRMIDGLLESVGCFVQDCDGFDPRVSRCIAVREYFVPVPERALSFRKHRTKVA